MLLVKADGGRIGGAHLQGEKGQIGRPEAAEMLPDRKGRPE